MALRVFTKESGVTEIESIPSSTRNCAKSGKSDGPCPQIPCNLYGLLIIVHPDIRHTKVHFFCKICFLTFFWRLWKFQDFLDRNPFGQKLPMQHFIFWFSIILFAFAMLSSLFWVSLLCTLPST